MPSEPLHPATNQEAGTPLAPAMLLGHGSRVRSLLGLPGPAGTSLAVLPPPPSVGFKYRHQMPTDIPQGTMPLPQGASEQAALAYEAGGMSHDFEETTGEEQYPDGTITHERVDPMVRDDQTAVTTAMTSEKELSDSRSTTRDRPSILSRGQEPIRERENSGEAVQSARSEIVGQDPTSAGDADQQQVSMTRTDRRPDATPAFEHVDPMARGDQIAVTAAMTSEKELSDSRSTTRDRPSIASRGQEPTGEGENSGQAVQSARSEIVGQDPTSAGDADQQQVSMTRTDRRPDTTPASTSQPTTAEKVEQAENSAGEITQMNLDIPGVSVQQPTWPALAPMLQDMAPSTPQVNSVKREMSLADTQLHTVVMPRSAAPDTASSSRNAMASTHNLQKQQKPVVRRAMHSEPSLPTSREIPVAGSEMTVKSEGSAAPQSAGSPRESARLTHVTKSHGIQSTVLLSSEPRPLGGPEINSLLHRTALESMEPSQYSVRNPSPLQQANPEIINPADRDATERIEQLRSTVQQLAAKVASQSTTLDRPMQPPAPPVVPPPAPSVVIVNRTARPTRTPRAFWERRYHGRLTRHVLR